ncbi:MAG: hypothetical protein DWQ07_15890 [Chloroflexi bacterium]|nr:MAG: hypothetical protein DWQ07_15890 [Chloroflexota bacterium]MBL1195232.1 hypothetical protein [Chloroflexota bacterium]NOH12517.1 hypothetical protein [Chloroflexota bacterium]
MQSSHLRPTLDISAALWAGLISGLVFLATGVLLPWLTLGDLGLILRILASIPLGPEVVPAGSVSPFVTTLVATVMHLALSLGFGMLIALVVHRWGLLVGILGGALMGLALYGINFFSLSFFFPWVFPLRNWMLLLAHILFGALAGGLYELFDEYDEPLVSLNSEATDTNS